VIICNILTNIVALCPCKNTVIIVPMTGVVECAVCHQKYRLKHLLYTKLDTPADEQGNFTFRHEVAVEPVGLVTALTLPGVPPYGRH
jgi:hypothetical protein